MRVKVVKFEISHFQLSSEFQKCFLVNSVISLHILKMTFLSFENLVKQIVFFLQYSPEIEVDWKVEMKTIIIQNRCSSKMFECLWIYSKILPKPYNWKNSLDINIVLTEQCHTLLLHVLGKLGKIKITFCEMREREKNCLLGYENVVVHIHSDETGKLF